MTKENLKSMSSKVPKPTLREQRRAARASKLMRQRLVIGGLVVLILAAILLLVFKDQLFNQAEDAVPTAIVATGEMITTASGLQYQDMVVGEGPAAKPGDTVSVHYTGWLEDGTQFDSSLQRPTPFEFTLGTGSVIDGWDEGVAGMQVGGTRRLILPPELAYGETGAGGVIPPNATLTFEVQLLNITSP